MNLELFPHSTPTEERLEEGAMLFRGHALERATALLQDIAHIVEEAPLRHMTTPGGHTMSVAMTNAGAAGWVTDGLGYRYSPLDPMTGSLWPPIPASWLSLAQDAARRAGFVGYTPDACLVNAYEPSARMSLHQDRNERDLGAPIVSVSLGLPAVFLWGGEKRTDPVRRLALRHGDVVVWGGPARLRHHGILPLKPGNHPETGFRRFNLTFRKTR